MWHLSALARLKAGIDLCDCRAKLQGADMVLDVADFRPDQNIVSKPIGD
jgi:hypothetical protein